MANRYAGVRCFPTLYRDATPKPVLASRRTSTSPGPPTRRPRTHAPTTTAAPAEPLIPALKLSCRRDDFVIPTTGEFQPLQPSPWGPATRGPSGGATLVPETVAPGAAANGGGDGTLLPWRVGEVDSIIIIWVGEFLIPPHSSNRIDLMIESMIFFRKSYLHDDIITMLIRIWKGDLGIICA